MAITKRDVEHVALLARLYLTEGEKEIFTAQLGQILEHAGKIAELDTSKVKPTSHAIPVCNVFRHDELRLCLTKNDALANAPEAEAGAFRVPRII